MSAEIPVPGPANPARVTTWIHDDGHQMLMAGLVWLLFVRVIVPGFFDYGNDATQGLNEGFFSNQAVWLTLLFIPLILLRSRLALTWLFLRSVNVFSALLILYACASTIWSIDPGATSRKLFHLLVLYLVCATSCLVGWHPKRLQNVVRPIVTLMLAASLIFGLIRPDLAISAPNLTLGETEYHWRGLANQKNGLGTLASFGVIFWFYAWLSKEAKWFASICGIALSALLLHLSASSTSLLATLVTCLFLLITQYLPRGLRKYLPYATAILIVVVLCYTLAVLKIVPGLDALVSSVASSVGKDTTFTGRSDIWAIIKEHIQLSPLLGSGFGAFWTGPLDTFSPSYVFMKRLFFYPWESHDGYLEIINDLGYVGLLILMGFIVNYLLLSFRLLKVDRNQALLYIGLMFYEFVANITESSWLSIGPVWLIMMFATFDMTRSLLERRMQAALGRPTASPGASNPPSDDRPFTTQSRLRSSGRGGSD
jgi:exopolysaccharide production protein ExoQ